jgi:hypothetical protein
VTFVTQTIDHVGRVFGSTRIACCGTTNVALLVEADYGVTSRWSVSFGLPYVFAKYRGEAPAGPAGFLPYPAVDSCHCVHSSIQDLQMAAHYNLLRIRRSFSLATSVSSGVPTHNYEYAGEAVVGFGLREVGVDVDAGQRLDFVLPGLSLDGRYSYTIVERALNIRHNRSNARLTPTYNLPKGIGAHAILSWQRTHGGLRFPDDVEPFPERYTEFHRLLRDNYFHAGAGVSYSWREWEFSGSFLRTVSGSNTHDIHVYTVTAGRQFRLRR